MKNYLAFFAPTIINVVFFLLFLFFNYIKIIMRKLLFAAVLTVITLFAFSQKYSPGYVVTLKGDTIHGELLNQKDSDAFIKCIIKKANNEIKTFLPKDIHEYKYIDGRYYVSKEIEKDGVKEILFLQFLLKGAVELYYYYDSKLVKERYYVLIDGKTIELTNNERNVVIDGLTYKVYDKKYIGVLKHLYADAPQVISDIDKLSFSTKSLIRISEEYHSAICSDESCEIFKGTGRKIHIGIRPFYKYEASTFTADYSIIRTHRTPNGESISEYISSSRELNSSSGYSYGLGLNILSSDLRFMLGYNLSKQRNTYTIDGDFGVIPLTIDDENIFTVNKLNHEILLRYAFTHYIIQPVLGLGGIVGQYKSIGNNTGEELRIMSYQGLVAELGARYNIKNRLFIEINAYFSQEWRRKTEGSMELKLKENLGGINFSVNYILF